MLEGFYAGLPENLQLVVDSAPYLWKGGVLTVKLSLGGMFFGIILGLGLALMRLSHHWFISMIAHFYVSAVRGTPLLVQLFLLYYGLPLYGIRLDPMTCGLIGFSLNSAAYTSETFRTAISSIDHGQWEAAASLGMTPTQAMIRVILPQAMRVALPSLSNSFIGLVKDTTLAATIQVPELFRQTQLVVARTFEVFTMYIAAALIYWILVSVLTFFQHRFEVQAGRYVKGR